MAQTYTHHGSHKNIDATAPRGLLFFRDFMVAFDSPSPAADGPTGRRGDPLIRFLLRDTKFILNASPPKSAQEMLNIRSKRTINYVRETQTIREIVNLPGNTHCVSTRTISYDCVLVLLTSGSTNGRRFVESGTLVLREDPKSGYCRLVQLKRIIAKAG